MEKNGSSLLCKKKSIIIILLLILIIGAGISLSFIIYKNYKEDKEQKRYAEIRESAKKATEHYLRATHPNCQILNGTSETYTTSGFENSSWFLNNGLIKKSELLDVDKKSYCDIYVKHRAYFENPLDHQRDCEVYYQIYLKCKNYEDKGYVEW